MSKFEHLLEALGEECPTCGEEPRDVVVLGPDDVRLYPCGHGFDLREWFEEKPDATE